MKTSHRLRLAAPLTGLTGLSFGAALLGAIGLWSQYTNAERAITAFLCLITGLSLGISISIAVDRRITDTPWLRIATIAVFLLLSYGVAVVRRNLVLEGV
ncbi:hypothetical protein [Couchioplanes caeruleus]|uniref:Uncharacterized protein n=2 Tax=Couchioplanes caeruleus TaxID=56438 RepID=A0A1K0G780_9ACTN|nr:hypothetical protein [Couchioplanes caeruleus]OJF13106.1 hypothetical protein BG844_16995 [Couchioplanes caeruleus subsp. caeruleus]ROP28226.1 hypothetical protein EDD30_0955 [Couchioplanes caeruleus]